MTVESFKEAECVSVFNVAVQEIVKPSDVQKVCVCENKATRVAPASSVSYCISVLQFSSKTTCCVLKEIINFIHH